MNYTILTTKSALNIGESDEEREALINEQNTILEGRGYDLTAVYVAHFFDSAFFDEQTAAEEVGDLVQMLATKEGIDLVEFENGRIGFVAYYGCEENGFEIIGSYADITENVREYVEELQENYKADFIRLWTACCNSCCYLDLDEPRAEYMVDEILSSFDSYGDEDLKAILSGSER